MKFTFALTLLVLTTLYPYSLQSYAANSSLARGKLDFHKGEIRKAHWRLWKLLRSDLLSQQRQLTHRERAEVRRLLGSSIFLLTGSTHQSKEAYRRSIEFSPKRNLFEFEKRDDRVENLYKRAAVMGDHEVRRAKRASRSLPVKIKLYNMIDKSGINEAIISVKDTYSPFVWTGESIYLEPGKHRFRIDAPGYMPTHVLSRVKSKKSTRTIFVNLKPLDILTYR